MPPMRLATVLAASRGRLMPTFRSCLATLWCLTLGATSTGAATPSVQDSLQITARGAGPQPCAWDPACSTPSVQLALREKSRPAMPLEAESGGCRLSLELLSTTRDRFRVSGAGFQGGAEARLESTSGNEVIKSTNVIPPDTSPPWRQRSRPVRSPTSVMHDDGSGQVNVTRHTGDRRRAALTPASPARRFTCAHAP